jgi:two-component system, NarL family, invasion response regulator UvrY
MGIAMTRVLIVDDHELVSDGLQRLVEHTPGFEVVTVCSSGDSLLALLASGVETDLCTVDLVMPGISGLELLRVLNSDWPDVAVLVCSANASAEVAVRCIRAGALGFISKFQPGVHFTTALRHLADGQRYIDPDLMTEVVSRLAADPLARSGYEMLSSREFAVMEMLARGQGIKDIAAAMFLSPKTVSTYRSRILTKLSVSSNAEITAYAVRNGLIELDTV